MARPDAIRAINQRWLLNFWKRNLGTTLVPRWQAIEAENLTRMSAALSFLDVVGAGPDTRFRIRFNGPTIAKVYGGDDCRGRFLDEIIPPARQAKALMAYHQVLASGSPVYTINEVRDRSGRIIHYERLLLPFGSDGATVDRILASFEFICEDGGFDADRLLVDGVPEPRLGATIAARAEA